MQKNYSKQFGTKVFNFHVSELMVLLQIKTTNSTPYHIKITPPLHRFDFEQASVHQSRKLSFTSLQNILVLFKKRLKNSEIFKLLSASKPNR